jgi:alkylation response protein AidB-like acyl-CoA dehydrogenase
MRQAESEPVTVSSDQVADFTPDEQDYRAELRKLLADVLPSDWVSMFSRPEAYEQSNRITQEVAERGLLIQHWPPEYGGSDASIWRQTVTQEELWAHGEPRGGQYMNVNWIGPSIMHFGTDAQKAELLPPMAAGQVTWAQLFSEPDAGSDLANLSTRARVLDDGSFVVNGQKVWISYGHLASKGFLLCRTGEGSRRHAGLSVLLIDMDTPGIERREIVSSLGANRFAEVFFTDVHIPARALLGELHDGWAVAMRALGFERSGSARYARSTRVLGHLEALVAPDDVVARRRIASLLAMGRAAELMNYNVIALKDQGQAPTWEASAARTHNALYEQGVAALAEETLGPWVQVKADSAPTKRHAEIASLYTSQAGSATITAGTYEIQLGIIAQRRLGLERAR